MATRAKGGYKTLLQRGDGATPTEAFTTVAEVKDISGPARRHVVEDVTSMDSTEGWAEKIAVGIKEAGDITFQMNFIEDDTSQGLINADLAAGTLRNFRIVLPGEQKRWSFAGYVMEIGEEHPVRGAMVAPVTIAISGKPVLEANT